ncbi:MAG: tRNA pseudouridine(13) synthase TruD, partial [bacterium]
MKSIRTEFPLAHGGPAGTAVLRSQPEDFVVVEQLGYDASGEGEHAFLKIRKRNLNTRDVINKLARFAGVKPSHVGYAGLKDRVAVTTQTFSVWLPGQADPDWQFLNDEQIQVVETARHGRKVR